MGIMALLMAKQKRLRGDAMIRVLMVKTRLFFCFLGILDRLVGSRKKMRKEAMTGIDMVKAGLCFYLLPECEANFGEDYAFPLVAAVVNTVFSESPSNETGSSFLQNEDNLGNVKLVIGSCPDLSWRCGGYSKVNPTHS